VRILVVGSAIVDRIVRPTSSIERDTSNEGLISWRAGGAARNVAETLARLGAAVTLGTPFLLARITELSGGRSLETNVALIRNNAVLAGEIAVALCDGSA
jgi:pseudouridine-5'-phosphate glycosidase